MTKKEKEKQFFFFYNYNVNIWRILFLSLVPRFFLCENIAKYYYLTTAHFYLLHKMHTHKRKTQTICIERNMLISRRDTSNGTLYMRLHNHTLNCCRRFIGLRTIVNKFWELLSHRIIVTIYLAKWMHCCDNCQPILLHMDRHCCRWHEIGDDDGSFC